jgi:hypothetical protein
VVVVNPFRRKVADMRHRYGAAAADYFIVHPECERCHEPRISTLTLHHKQGKKVEEFEVLCFNCHMLEHSNSPDYTYDDHLRWEEQKSQKSVVRKERNDKILELNRSGLSLRQIAKQADISHIMVRSIITSSDVGV